jgi:hypothetical protein
VTSSRRYNVDMLLAAAAVLRVDGCSRGSGSSFHVSQLRVAFFLSGSKKDVERRKAKGESKAGRGQKRAHAGL